MTGKKGPAKATLEFGDIGRRLGLEENVIQLNVVGTRNIYHGRYFF
jgi:hypothetical protein